MFNKMGLEAPTETKEHGVLNDETQFKEEFFFYFKQGAAAERYVADRDLFDRFVETSRQLNFPTGLGKLMYNIEYVNYLIVTFTTFKAG